MGKPSAPPPPDYAAAAQAQGQANRETAQFNAGANRVNQIGPQGSTVWTIRPGADLNNPQPGDYIQTTTLSPGMQQQYDAGNRITQSLLGTAEQQLGRVSQGFGQPLDMSGLPGMRTSATGGNLNQIPVGTRITTPQGQQQMQRALMVDQRQPAMTQQSTGNPSSSPIDLRGAIMGMNQSGNAGKGGQPPQPGASWGGAATAANAASGGGSGAGGTEVFNTQPAVFTGGTGGGGAGAQQYSAGKELPADATNTNAYWQSLATGRYGGDPYQAFNQPSSPATGSGYSDGFSAGGGSNGVGASNVYQTPGARTDTGFGSQGGFGGGGFGAQGVQGPVDDTSRQRVESAILSRLEPQYAKDQSSLQNQLLSRGLEVGSPAYNSEMDRLSRSQNDARMQAILAGGQEQSRMVGLNSGLQNQAFNQGLQGAQFDNQTRQQMLSELLMNRNLSLNELNALRTGSQVSMPQFGSYYTNNANASPMFDAAVQQGNYNQNAYQQQMAGANGLFGGLANLGSAAIMYSDIRLKKCIKQIGTLPSGLGLYSWEWRDGSGHDTGVLAQEVQKAIPDAVHVDSSTGFLMVDYSKIR